MRFSRHSGSNSTTLALWMTWHSCLTAAVGITRPLALINNASEGLGHRRKRTVDRTSFVIQQRPCNQKIQTFTSEAHLQHQVAKQKTQKMKTCGNEPDRTHWPEDYVEGVGWIGHAHGTPCSIQHHKPRGKRGRGRRRIR